MIRWVPGNVREEIFELSDFTIKMDYGLMDDGFISGKVQYLPISKRYSARCRRTRLFDNEDNLISVCIEKNPDYVTGEEEERLFKDHLLKGDEFEKVVNFPDGKVAKVEYWNTLDSRDENFGRYTAKFRRIVVFAKNQEILSEVFDRNPHYRKDGNKIVPSHYISQEGCDLSELL